jgi:glycosyltransferase involved in cell wall biosynthesis
LYAENHNGIPEKDTAMSSTDGDKVIREGNRFIDVHGMDARKKGTVEPPIRIAIVISHPIQHFAPLHRELASLSGVELKVFFCASWGAESHFDPDFGIQLKWDIPLLDGYSWEFLPGRQDAKWLGFTGCDNPSIASALHLFEPDIVQVIGYAHRTMWRAVDWSRKNRVPVLLSSDSNANHRRPIWKRLAKAIVVRSFYRRVDGAFFVGDNNYLYHSHYGIPTDRLFPGALPIDRRRLTTSAGDRSSARREIRAKHGIPENAFVAVYSGKMYPGKAPSHLLSATELCTAMGADVWALFVGDGVERASLERLIEASCMRNVVLAGFVNQSAIAKYYAASDVLVVPSARDNHPLIVSEAGCFGLPAIVSDRLGCIGQFDTARAGENALVYPFGDIEELADCIVRLSSDNDLYLTMSRAAMQIAGSQDIAVTAEQLRDAAARLRRLGCRP